MKFCHINNFSTGSVILVSNKGNEYFLTDHIYFFILVILNPVLPEKGNVHGSFVL